MYKPISQQSKNRKFCAVLFVLVLQDQIRQATMIAGDNFDVSVSLTRMNRLSQRQHLAVMCFPTFLALYFNLLMHVKI